MWFVRNIVLSTSGISKGRHRSFRFYLECFPICGTSAQRLSWHWNSLRGLPPDAEHYLQRKLKDASASFKQFARYRGVEELGHEVNGNCSSRVAQSFLLSKVAESVTKNFFFRGIVSAPMLRGDFPLTALTLASMRGAEDD